MQKMVEPDRKLIEDFTTEELLKEVTKRLNEIHRVINKGPRKGNDLNSMTDYFMKLNELAGKIK